MQQLRKISGKSLCSKQCNGWLLHRKLSSFCPGRLARILQKFNGYRSGVICCAWISGLVLLLNLVFLLSAFGVSDTVNGVGVLYSGSCNKSSTLGFWIHLLINILSTALLGASNYTMQCLSSPTRAEIDTAHSKGKWLDIGVPSVRNLRSVARHRQILWLALAISALPLHLLWNSAFFVSLSGQVYTAWVVPSDFALFNPTAPRDPATPDPLSQPLYSETYPEPLGPLKRSWNYSDSLHLSASYPKSNTSTLSTAKEVHLREPYINDCVKGTYDGLGMLNYNDTVIWE